MYLLFLSGTFYNGNSPFYDTDKKIPQLQSCGIFFVRIITLLLKLHGKGAAFPIDTLDADLAAEYIHHPLDKRQTKTVALGGMGGIALVELFKDMLPTSSLRADAIRCS